MVTKAQMITEFNFHYSNLVDQGRVRQPRMHWLKADIEQVLTEAARMTQEVTYDIESITANDAYITEACDVTVTPDLDGANQFYPVHVCPDNSVIYFGSWDDSVLSYVYYRTLEEAQGHQERSQVTVTYIAPACSINPQYFCDNNDTAVQEANEFYPVHAFPDGTLGYFTELGNIMHSQYWLLNGLDFLYYATYTDSEHHNAYDGTEVKMVTSACTLPRT